MLIQSGDNIEYRVNIVIIIIIIVVVINHINYGWLVQQNEFAVINQRPFSLTCLEYIINNNMA